jgi:CRISPR-associated protein Cas5h
MQRLTDCLQAGHTEYTVTLGLASCIADITWVGEWDAQPITTIEWDTRTVIPVTADMVINYKDGRHYHRLRVPAVMDGNRVVNRYQEVVVAEDSQAICGHGGQDLFYVLDHETIAFL